MFRSAVLFVLSLAVSLALFTGEQAEADDVVVPFGLRQAQRSINVAGGFDYLPDGDIVAIDQLTGTVYRFDANRDRFPSSPATLYQIPLSQYGSFVRVAPSGRYLLLGAASFPPSASDQLIKIDLITGMVTPVASVAGNFDLLFLSENQVLVSANESLPNRILYLDLTTANPPIVVAELPGVPSGPVAVNSAGDLYYVRGTYNFPPPLDSHALLRFTKGQLDSAIAGGGVLAEADAELVTLLDSGYDLAINTAKSGRNEIFVSELSGRIQRFVEGESDVTEFASSAASGGSFTVLAFFKPHQQFTPQVATRGKLGSAFSINYIENYFVEITAEDHDGDDRPDDIINGVCSSDESDCVNEKLNARACVGANGFLSQVNIASIINQSPVDLLFTLQYYTQQGFLRSSLDSILIRSRLKSDFIVNDLGLQADSIGTLCVSAKTMSGVDAPPGSWSGGMALYKPDTRQGNSGRWGESFDFALFSPFENARFGTNVAPLNTFRLGMDSRDVVANWISIADAKVDAQPLEGVLTYFDASGSVVHVEQVSVPDGGRRDLAGHVGLTMGRDNGVLTDAVGTAEFAPRRVAGRELPYYLTVTRYFYDCGGGACNNFHTAFNLPTRPAAQSAVMGGVAAANGELSIIELSNVSETNLDTSFGVFNLAGQNLGAVQASVPGRGTQHFIINRVDQQGFLAAGEVGSATVQPPRNGLGAARSMFYKLNDLGRLEYGYAAAFRGSLTGAQSTQFNTFINHTNSVELFNASSSPKNVVIQFVDFAGTLMQEQPLLLPGLGGVRFDALGLPTNTLGTVRIAGVDLDLSVRNYTVRKDQYVLPFAGISETPF